MSVPLTHARGGDFDENSPRPPVPGEETESYRPIIAHHHHDIQQYPRYNPLPTPRASSVHYTSTCTNTQIEPNAPLGFEPEGSCYGNHGSNSPFYEGTRSPPSCLRWARNLPCLLQDEEGVCLFTKYLEQEGKPHADALKFWFACEGLRKQQNTEKVHQLVKVIYKKFLLQSQLGIREELRREVTSCIKEARVDSRIFDDAQAEVERTISTTTYPNFLKSDIYLQCVQQQQLQQQQSHTNEYTTSSSSGSGSGSGSSSSSGGRDAAGLCCPSGNNMLPTLHEDSELCVVNTDPPLPLTRDMLMVTQGRRALDLRPKPEAYAGLYLQHGPQLIPRAYSSYNPVSRQDSELQSLSSDARTDSDAMSCTDSSVDGASLGYHSKLSKHQLQKQYRAIKEKASINRDMSQHVIPRTQRKDQPHPIKPEEFAAILTHKLEVVKRELEAQEKLDRKLSESEMVTDHTLALADVIREKLQVDDMDCDQAILDQHVSRVWSDLTPSRSPGLISPRPKSPDAFGGRRKLITATGYPHAHPTRTSYCPKYTRKEKDVFSTFSSDSGNVHDFPDCSDSGLPRHMTKSRSVPDYVDVQKSEACVVGETTTAGAAGGGGGGGVRTRSRDVMRRACSGSSKKTLTELTDSGVSVVSADTVPSKDASWVMSWLMDNSKQTSSSTSCHSHTESSSCSKHRTARMSSTSVPVAYRHGRKSERSGSLERYPQQPFVADPSMPPLPLPHTATQLEEACRRLKEDDNRGKLPRQRSSKISGAPTGPPDLSISNQSTLRKSQRHQRPGDEFTTVVFSFCDEQFPYRTKIPGRPVTLKQFKEFLPKKGVYRYYFKTECEDVDTKVIQEEVVDDSEILPLWEGKIMAQVKPVE